MLVLFVALFAWIALSFTSALAGFFALLTGGGLAPAGAEISVPATRTALLMPTYNESPQRVTAGLQAIWEALQAAGPAGEPSTSSSSATPPIPTPGSRRKPRSWRCARAPAATTASSIATASATPRASPATSPTGSRGSAPPIQQFLILDADSVMSADDADPSGERDGAASRRRPDPDAADRHRRHHAVRPAAAVRRPRLWPADRAWHRLVARRGGQLLGPQRPDPHTRFRRVGRPAGTARAASRSAARS